jgi:uncharacterized membrane protein YvbJ
MATETVEVCPHCGSQNITQELTRQNCDDCGRKVGSPDEKTLKEIRENDAYPDPE